MRKQHNIKSIGFTYTTPVVGIIEAINADSKHTLPVVTHIDVRGNTVVTKELVKVIRKTSQGVPVFHRMKHEIEMPSCLGVGLDLLAS
jgi:hypothetical protein